MATGRRRRSRLVAVVATVAVAAVWTPQPVGAEGASGASVAQAQVAARLDAYDGHACAVTDAGEVVCWGLNDEGQLGDGTTNGADEPVPTDPLPAPGRAQAVAVGGSHTCALLVDGRVSCWGANWDGQLGTGGAGDPLEAPSAPIDLPPPGRAVQIAAGGDVTCALLSDGKVTCWGDDSGGALGNGATGDQAAPPAPLTLPGPGTAIAVSVGSAHSCVLLTNGGVSCWGGGSSGQLGDGLGTGSDVPVGPIALPSPGTATAVSAGDQHTCAILADGDVTCWGGDSRGELGNGAGGQTNSPPAPVALPGGALAVSVAAGDDGTCVSLSSGDVSCWGSGRYYRLGTGSILDAQSPTGPIDMPGGLAASAVAVGRGTVCAIAGPAVTCWGDDVAGGAGVGDQNGTNLEPSTPFDVIGDNLVASVVAYNNGTCSLQQPSGVVRCWGLNDDGQLGLGTADLEAHESPGARVDFPAPDTITALDAFMEHLCAVQSNGSVACWGLDQEGQVGNGNASSEFEPNPVTVTLPAPGTASDVSVGYSFSCALLTDDDVTCWGDDSNGQLGNGAATGTVHAPPAPITLPAPGTADKVAAGQTFACALLTDGKVTCWGSDSRGELGNGASSSTVTAPPAPITLPSPGTAVDIQAGPSHACALLTDGKVACWGDDTFGQVGNGPGTTTITSPVAVALPAPGTATALALGQYHTCALLTGGAVTCWGRGINGQLGTGVRVSTLTAPSGTALLGVTATAIAAGFDHTCAALATGLVSCWGADAYGQLGNGSADGDAVHTPQFLLDTIGRPVWVPDFTPLRPARLLDTRPGFATVDGQFAGGGTISGGSTLQLQVGGRGGVAPNAEAAALNVTAVGPAGSGWVTVYPCGASQPNASNLNVVAGVNVANSVIAQLGTQGKVCIFASVTTHLLVDVTGVAPLTSAFAGGAPERFLETRAGPSFTTIDGQSQGAGVLPAGTVTQLQITGRGSTPIAASTKAVILNVTAVTPAAGGYLTVFPCGATQPTASNLNFVPGRSTPNAVLVGIGTAGRVCIFNSSSTHLVADVVGVLNTASHSAVPNPKRLLETRVGPAYVTFDGIAQGGGKVDAGGTVTVPVRDRGVNEDVRFVWLNVTSVQSEAGGYLTVHACDQERPNASNLNFPAGVTVANSVLVELSGDGEVCIFSSARTHLIADLGGVLIDGYIDS